MKNPLPLAKLLSHEQFSEATNGEKARIFGAKDGLGNTPLMAAALSGKPDSISLLVGEGAPPTR
jgi:ankyrin repeat protein